MSKDEAASGTDGESTITADEVCSWTAAGSERECAIFNDTVLIMNNQDPSIILQALSAYSNYLSDKSGQHEDFIRDTCSRLVQEDSPFKDKFVDVYKYFYGADYSDDEIQAEIDSGALVVDAIISYFSCGGTDAESTYKFIYSYLACLAGNNSISPPKNLSANANEILKSKMVEAFRNLAGDFYEHFQPTLILEDIQMAKIITSALAKRRIAKHNPDDFEIAFEGYTSIEVDAAKLIAQVKNGVDLREITEISDEVAEALGTYCGSLDLGGLKTLSPNVAKALAALEGWLHLQVPELSDAAAAELAKCKARLKLTGLKTLNNCSGHIELAKKLLKDGTIDRLYFLANVAKEVFDAVPELKMANSTLRGGQ